MSRKQRTVEERIDPVTFAFMESGKQLHEVSEDLRRRASEIAQEAKGMGCEAPERKEILIRAGEWLLAAIVVKERADTNAELGRVVKGRRYGGSR